MDAAMTEAILSSLGMQRIKSTGGGKNIMFCCPYHAESNPSCGISPEKNSGACFSCGQSFNIASLTMHVLQCSYKSAVRYLEEFGYEDEFEFTQKKKLLKKARIHRNDFIQENDGKYLPYHKLAPYQCGKRYPKYLKERGFPEDIVKEFKIGWDKENLRFIIPILGSNGKDLHGFVRGAIVPHRLPNGEKNPEYEEVYGREPKYLLDNTLVKSKTFYGLDHLALNKRKELIIVEGFLDMLRMHSYGFYNTLGIINAEINYPQLTLLKQMGVKRIISMLDNDDAGLHGNNALWKKARRDFILSTIDYPDKVKDPAEMTRNQVIHALENKRRLMFFS